MQYIEKQKDNNSLGSGLTQSEGYVNGGCDLLSYNSGNSVAGDRELGGSVSPRNETQQSMQVKRSLSNESEHLRTADEKKIRTYSPEAPESINVSGVMHNRDTAVKSQESPSLLSFSADDSLSLSAAGFPHKSAESWRNYRDERNTNYENGSGDSGKIYQVRPDTSTISPDSSITGVRTTSDINSCCNETKTDSRQTTEAKAERTLDVDQSESMLNKQSYRDHKMSFGSDHSVLNCLGPMVNHDNKAGDIPFSENVTRFLPSGDTGKVYPNDNMYRSVCGDPSYVDHSSISHYNSAVNIDQRNNDGSAGHYVMSRDNPLLYSNMRGNNMDVNLIGQGFHNSGMGLSSNSGVYSSGGSVANSVMMNSGCTAGFNLGNNNIQGNMDLNVHSNVQANQNYTLQPNTTLLVNNVRGPMAAPPYGSYGKPPDNNCESNSVLPQQNTIPSPSLIPFQHQQLFYEIVQRLQKRGVVDDLYQRASGLLRQILLQHQTATKDFVPGGTQVQTLQRRKRGRPPKGSVTVPRAVAESIIHTDASSKSRLGVELIPKGNGLDGDTENSKTIPNCLLEENGECIGFSVDVPMSCVNYQKHTSKGGSVRGGCYLELEHRGKILTTDGLINDELICVSCEGRLAISTNSSNLKCTRRYILRQISTFPIILFYEVGEHSNPNVIAKTKDIRERSSFVRPLSMLLKQKFVHTKEGSDVHLGLLGYPPFWSGEVGREAYLSFEKFIPDSPMKLWTANLTVTHQKCRYKQGSRMVVAQHATKPNVLNVLSIVDVPFCTTTCGLNGRAIDCNMYSGLRFDLFSDNNGGNKMNEEAKGVTAPCNTDHAESDTKKFDYHGLDRDNVDDTFWVTPGMDMRQFYNDENLSCEVVAMRLCNYLLTFPNPVVNVLQLNNMVLQDAILGLQSATKPIIFPSAMNPRLNSESSPNSSRSSISQSLDGERSTSEDDHDENNSIYPQNPVFSHGTGATGFVTPHHNMQHVFNYKTSNKNPINPNSNQNFASSNLQMDNFNNGSYMPSLDINNDQVIQTGEIYHANDTSNTTKVQEPMHGGQIISTKINQDFKTWVFLKDGFRNIGTSFSVGVTEGLYILQKTDEKIGTHMNDGLKIYSDTINDMFRLLLACCKTTGNLGKSKILYRRLRPPLPRTKDKKYYSPVLNPGNYSGVTNNSITGLTDLNQMYHPGFQDARMLGEQFQPNRLAGMGLDAVLPNLKSISNVQNLNFPNNVHSTIKGNVQQMMHSNQGTIPMNVEHGNSHANSAGAGSNAVHGLSTAQQGIMNNAIQQGTGGNQVSLQHLQNSNLTTPGSGSPNLLNSRLRNPNLLPNYSHQPSSKTLNEMSTVGPYGMPNLGGPMNTLDVTPNPNNEDVQGGVAHEAKGHFPIPLGSPFNRNVVFHQECQTGYSSSNLSNTVLAGNVTPSLLNQCMYTQGNNQIGSTNVLMQNIQSSSSHYQYEPITSEETNDGNVDICNPSHNPVYTGTNFVHEDLNPGICSVYKGQNGGSKFMNSNISDDVNGLRGKVLNSDSGGHSSDGLNFNTTRRIGSTRNNDFNATGCNVFDMQYEAEYKDNTISSSPRNDYSTPVSGPNTDEVSVSNPKSS